jgi:phosphoribosylglycinamide formyltransferase-1
MSKKKIAILCSGSGSNAEKIIEYFKNHANISVALLMANKADAFALVRASNHGVPNLVFNKAEFHSDTFLKILQSHEIDFLVLAGFLWLMPEHIIEAYPDRIINIHPALLPAYGGKGMYGHFVHEAIVKNKEKYTGITIHFVNKNYDEGTIIFQAECAVQESDTPEDVAKKVQVLEHRHFAVVIEKLLLEKY